MKNIHEKIYDLKQAITTGTTSLKHVDILNEIEKEICEIEESVNMMPEAVLDESAQALGGIIIENINVYVNKKDE